MPLKINHIHIKSADPRKIAEWYEKAFEYKIISDETRVWGDRFIRMSSGAGGIIVTISGPRTNETLRPGDANPHYGLEHFAVETPDIDAEIARLKTLGAELQEGPTTAPNGTRFAFLAVPDTVRLELLQLPK
jgi:catechol 2,3-dioxygenase-like lactoylglutathione lyase family enzyme